MEINENRLLDTATTNITYNDTVSIPLIKEEVIVNKRIVETNKIRITKHVDEESRLVDLALIKEEIKIETVPINQYVDVAPQAIRYEGDTTIISVIKEVVVVRISLEKEIRITKKRIETQHIETVVLKTEDVTIENIAPINNQPVQG